MAGEGFVERGEGVGGGGGMRGRWVEQDGELHEFVEWICGKGGSFAVVWRGGYGGKGGVGVTEGWGWGVV